MKLESHYQDLWENSLKKFRSGDFDSDPNIDNPSDDRYGITLLARPSIRIKHKIAEFLQELYPFAPRQYYYPTSDLHITVLSIISCQPGFRLEQIKSDSYINTIDSVIRNIKPMQIEFKGITASSSALMICGYPKNESLDKLRNELRTTFKKSALYHTIDKRYTLKTAHITILRFRHPPSAPDDLIKKLSLVKERSFGIDLIDELELVGNDWYQREENTELLKHYKL